MGNSVDFKKVLKTAGAFMAWVIGSGFATGQEVLQFFPATDTAVTESSFLIWLASSESAIC